MLFLQFIFQLTISSVTVVLCWYPDYEVPGGQSYHGVHNGMEYAKSFENEWTVQVDGGEEVAQLIAVELGYVYGGPVKWAEQLFTKSREKRYTVPDPDATIKRMKRVEVFDNINNATDGREKRDIKGNNKPLFNDELWSHEWYLQDTRTMANLPRLDLNVLPVYAMGYNGHGVRLSILDDGIEHNHTDLRENYDPEISWDCNDRDSDPTPRYEQPMRNSHGTRCAGEIAMTANNRKCGVGVAWGAKVGGIRMLDGRITDRIEGEAIAYACDKVDIYSASWGPYDNGRTVEGPGRLATEAFKRCVTEGRGGKGAIYVWANGNGGGNHDNCNCDGYSSSIYTISIGSASQQGLFPWYGETCSSTLAVAYSSGAYKDQKIVSSHYNATTDTGDSCTLKHSGTSAAAPLAAGIIALALQANPNLTWRDVQHLVVWTSEYAPLSANPGWQINGVGLRFDVRFGFGLLNAGALVLTALNWTTVPEKHICSVGASPLSEEEARFSSKEPIAIIIKVENCIVNYIEHVELIVNIQYTRRGALELYLISPQGTRIQVLSPRPVDSSTAGFVNWPLTSVATWGENPNGVWTVVIQDKTGAKNKGILGHTSLVLHGTHEMPDHMKNGPRNYNYSYNYQEVFDYFDNIDSDDQDTVTGDNNVAESPETHNKEKLIDANIDSSILNEVENELFRIHHRNNDMSNFGFGI
ncbi:neuroendocrine convertase 1-like isoform X2 [Pectinophora gossypiella]|uniref:neuroendocrine convertase 1-like isoform X2 n=1 Tax=Pectinophora gossypiella TaxID=13191 RepID=UPI00214EAC84|nr:neuroendocrine convertase 1-like isoform X2 [Pectinophora gossypiella]